MSELSTLAALAPGGAERLRGPGGPEPAGAKSAAEEFEAMFLAQMLQSLTRDLDAAGPLGGGEGDPFRTMLTDEIGKLISRAGGIGVGDSILQEMLKMQEVT